VALLSRISWCKKQKDGIKLIELNDNLSREYIQTAEESFEVLKLVDGKSKMWAATTKYYCEYFAIYALLMKLGIKCEIHDCTIEICKLLEKEDVIPLGFSKVLEDDKKLRIENQYDLKNKEVKIGDTINFILRIKDVINKLTFEQISKVRSLLV